MWFIIVKANSAHTQILSYTSNRGSTKEDHRNKSTMLSRLRELQIKHPDESYSLVYIDSSITHELISKLN